MSATVDTPTRSLEQRRAALARANEVRLARAVLKRGVRARRVRVGEVLLAPAAEFESMRVFELLLVVPKVGRVRASRWLRDAGVSPSKTIGGLSERQRRELVVLMGDRLRSDSEATA